MDNIQIITHTSEEEWNKAQEYEKNTWVVNNKNIKNNVIKIIYKFIKALRVPKRFINFLRFKDFYCGDDWNYWWLSEFENYKLLPKKIEKSLEVGCGPYSNTRLISKLINIREIFCSDPLMDVYKKFKRTWISEMSKTGKINALTGRAEAINHPNNFFDLCICINVLDHVQNAEECLLELTRVLKPGGYLVFGQELVDENDLLEENIKKDFGHPIKLDQKYLDSVIMPRFFMRFQKILFREQGRDASHRGGTYLYIGIKK